MKRNVKITIGLGICGAIIAAGYTLGKSDTADLIVTHQAIEREFAEVSHIDGDDLSTLAEQDIILLDVREPSEYNVSHLKGAVRVDPDMTADDFIENFSNVTAGKTVIFYCSVGQRSSSFANRVQDLLMSSGARAAYNLEGGIFQWHNENRLLVNNSAEPTRYVHPYNPIWGRMIENRKYTQY